jgi:hypothetical protein
VLIPAEKASVIKPLDGYRMDSMTAAEFRTRFYQAFNVGVPFLELLSKTAKVCSSSKAVLRRWKGVEIVRPW